MNSASVPLKEIFILQKEKEEVKVGFRGASHGSLNPAGTFVLVAYHLS
jgi:hypothetical protein